MCASMFLAGVILFGLILAQMVRVYEADRAYKDELRK